jgi:hypothetical protein
VSDIRHFINLLEYYAPSVPDVVVEEVIEEAEAFPVAERLQDLMEKLRAYSSPSEGDLGLGEETGAEMAADMIENLIRQMGEHTK